jgi:hypothetical protein
MVAQMDKIFLDNYELLIYLSTIWSFVSLLKGLLSYIEVKKSNFLPLLGKLLLLHYFAIGLSGRLFAIVLFCTPLLGLFDTNYHAIFGKMSVQTEFFPSSVKRQTFYLFDYTTNNTEISFDELWQKFQIKNLHLSSYPTWVSILCIALILLHIVTSYILQSKLHRKSNNKSAYNIFQSIYTLLCPPMFIDWEEIYRKHKGLITFKQSWQKSQKFLISHIVMHSFEHSVLCIPLILFQTSISERNEQLVKFFPPLDDEKYSTYMVNVLIGTGLAVAVVLPPIQYGLSRVYFTKGHPWSGLLNYKLYSEDLDESHGMVEPNRNE